MYKILGGDGNEYGPVSADTLRQWVREGRANALTQVKPEGAGQWQALSSITELTDIFGATADAPPTIGALPAGRAPAASGALHDGDYELDIMGCVSRAWAVLTANFWLAVGGSAIYLLIIGGLAGFAQIPFVGMVFSLVSLLITGPLMGGLYFFSLRVLRGQPAEVGQVFAGFRDNLGQLILAHIIPAIIAGATALPGIIMITVSAIFMSRNHEANPGLIVLLVFGLLLAFVPLIYFFNVLGVHDSARGRPAPRILARDEGQPRASRSPLVDGAWTDHRRGLDQPGRPAALLRRILCHHTVVLPDACLRI